MNLKELSQLYYLKREIDKKSDDIKELQARKWGHSTKISGMPKTKDNESQLERIEVEIEDLMAIIGAKQIELIHERNRLERYIADIPDSETRMIFEYRFVDCKSWDDVAACMGEGNTAERVRQVCSRYLRQNA